MITENAVKWLGIRRFLTELVPNIALSMHVCFSIQYLGSIRVPFAAIQCLISHLIALRISI